MTDSITIKKALLQYLKGKDWVYGGQICRDLAYELKHKESVIERHGLRGELVKGEDPEVESRYVPNPSGRGAQVLQYRLKKQGKLL